MKDESPAPSKKQKTDKKEKEPKICKKKSEKESDGPKKPPNAYALYQQEMRPIMK